MDGKHAASTLRELQERFGLSQTDMLLRAQALGPDFALGRNWLSNIRSNNAVPDIRKIYALSEVFRLALDDLLALFGYNLTALSLASADIHTQRTRLLEHRITGLSESTVPSSFAKLFQSASTAYLSQVASDWRTVPTNQLRGDGWQAPHLFYAKLGVNDSNAAPAIPPGAYLQVLKMPAKMTSPLSPSAIYLIQHPWGLTASRCALHEGMLYIHSENPSYSGPFRLKHGSRGRVLGLVTAFASELPTAPYQRSDESPTRPGAASSLAPWEHRRPNDLFFEQYRRCGLRRKEFDESALALFRLYGLEASAKYVEELRSSEHFPRTSTLLALSVLTATRISDILTSCGVPHADRVRFRLPELLSRDCRSLPPAPAPAAQPQPLEAWTSFKSQWMEWPLLLQPLFRSHADLPRSVLRFDQRSARYTALPFLPETSFLLLQRHRGGYAALNENALRSDWARQLYVIEHGRDRPVLDCGYLAFEDEKILLTPHHSAPATPPAIFKKNDVTIIGTVSGIAAKL